MALPIVSTAAPAAASPRSSAPLELPTVRALGELYDEVVSRPLWLPSRLVRYLALRRRMRLMLLDPARTKIVTPRGKVNDCNSCTDSCCLGGRNTVLLRLRDVATLIDVGRPELMTHDKPAFSDAMTRARPALRRQLHSAAWQAMPVLKQHAFGACMALDTAGRCTLFPHWPLSCARFPLSLDVESEEIFYAQRCGAFWIHPAEAPRARAMADAAVDSYNERIKDAILLTFARRQLADLGVLRYVSL